MVSATAAISAARALPAYAEALKIGRSLDLAALAGGSAREGGTRSQARFDRGDRFVRTAETEAERDPGLAAYLRAGKLAAGRGGATDAGAETAREVNRLRARDQEVRSHEAAHIAAGGSHIRSAASYTFETGPDGKQYAVGGEVSIDVSPVAGNPQATLAKMTAVRAAALAPAEPSSADVAVANAAAQAAVQAQAELREQRAAGDDAEGGASGRPVGAEIRFASDAPGPRPQ